jgi:frataxin-like iron-binding protein CyaY
MGIKTNSFLFGYLPRSEIRRNYCNNTVAKKVPKLTQELKDIRLQLELIYKESYPAIYKNHQEVSKKILQNWRFKDSCFSSGIINKNNQLGKHKDSGNIPNTNSMMLVLKKNCIGGDLYLNELGVTISLNNGAVVIFNGQAISHQVLPFINKRGGYRYSIVYYTLQKLWMCLEPKEELERYTLIRERAEKRQRQIRDLPEELKKEYIKASVKERVKILANYASSRKKS